MHAEDLAALSAASWNFITEHLETGDIIDLLVLVEIRTKELHQELQTLEELKIDLESNANATHYYSGGDWSSAQQWEVWKETTKLQSRISFHQGRTRRKHAQAANLQSLIASNLLGLG